VSPQPGETKNISSLKVCRHLLSNDLECLYLRVKLSSRFVLSQIASHPSVYILDTPGILPSKVHDVEVCSKLALTGIIMKPISFLLCK